MDEEPRESLQVHDRADGNGAHDREDLRPAQNLTGGKNHAAFMISGDDGWLGEAKDAPDPEDTPTDFFEIVPGR